MARYRAAGMALPLTRCMSSQPGPFAPDARTRVIFDRAARTAYRTSRVLGFDEVLNGRSFHVWPDRR
jgi:hypothetical protein